MSNFTRRLFLRSAPAAGVALTVATTAPAETKPSLTLDERIDAALAEIVAVYRERYPNCPIRIDDIVNQDGGSLIVLTNCGNDAPGTVTHRRREGGRETARVIVDDGSPLLPDDVTGTTAYADWEASRKAVKS